MNSSLVLIAAKLCTDLWLRVKHRSDWLWSPNDCKTLTFFSFRKWHQDFLDVMVFTQTRKMAYTYIVQHIYHVACYLDAYPNECLIQICLKWWIYKIRENVYPLYLSGTAEYRDIHLSRHILIYASMIETLERKAKILAKHLQCKQAKESSSLYLEP